MSGGVGSCSAGSSIAGFGEVEEALVVNTSFLPNPQNQRVMDAPLLQSAVSVGGLPYLDIIYDASFNLSGMDSIDQQVLLAIATIAGTAIDVNVGSNLLSLTTINPTNYQALTQHEVELALNDLINAGSITLVNVIALLDPQTSGRGNISITYVNNRLNIQRTLDI